MTRTRIALLLTATAFVAACSTLKTNTDWNRTADFSGYKTFALKGGTPAPSSITQGRICTSITRGLPLEVYMDIPCLIESGSRRSRILRISSLGILRKAVLISSIARSGV